MGNWSYESLCKAEEAMADNRGTWHEKLSAAIDAAIAQRCVEEREARSERLAAKIEELEKHDATA